MAKEASKKKSELTDAQKAEAKRAAFVKVVSPRVGKALKAIRLIGNCGSSNYLYTPEQVKGITEALSAAVKQVENIFARTSHKLPEFTLPV